MHNASILFDNGLSAAAATRWRWQEQHQQQYSQTFLFPHLHQSNVNNSSSNGTTPTPTPTLEALNTYSSDQLMQLLVVYTCVPVILFANSQWLSPLWSVPSVALALWITVRAWEELPFCTTTKHVDVPAPAFVAPFPYDEVTPGWTGLRRFCLDASGKRAFAPTPYWVSSSPSDAAGAASAGALGAYRYSWCEVLAVVACEREFVAGATGAFQLSAAAGVMSMVLVLAFAAALAWLLAKQLALCAFLRANQTDRRSRRCSCLCLCVCYARGAHPFFLRVAHARRALVHCVTRCSRIDPPQAAGEREHAGGLRDESRSDTAAALDGSAPAPAAAAAAPADAAAAAAAARAAAACTTSVGVGDSDSVAVLVGGPAATSSSAALEMSPQPRPLELELPPRAPAAQPFTPTATDPQRREADAGEEKQRQPRTNTHTQSPRDENVCDAGERRPASADELSEEDAGAEREGQARPRLAAAAAAALAGVGELGGTQL